MGGGVRCLPDTGDKLPASQPGWVIWGSDKIIAQTLSPSQKYSLQPGWINWRGLTAQQRVSLASAHLKTLKT